MARIAIIGCGAIGGTLAAHLLTAGRHDTIVYARRAVAEITVHTPDGNLVVAPQVVTDPCQALPADFVLVTTKAYDAESTAAWFAGLVRPHTIVAILQNGVEHRERFAAYLPLAQILPVIVLLPAERSTPERIHQRTAARLTVPDETHGRAFAALFADTRVAVDAAPDFKNRLWRKLCGNAPGILNALLLQPTRVMHDEAVAELTRAITRECVAVGEAEGAVFEPDIVEVVLQGCRRAPPDSINSLHADRLAGRPLEIDARNGVIVRLGRKHAIPTPCTLTCVRLLEALGRVAPCAP
jgi:2-dehydropantoate 2-reductase